MRNSRAMYGPIPIYGARPGKRQPVGSIDEGSPNPEGTPKPPNETDATLGADALVKVIEILNPLTQEGRIRVLRAVEAYFDIDE